MADEKVRQIQQWLNFQYNFGIDEDGYTGGITVNALKKALQIELGLEPDGSFGPTTESTFNTMFPNGLNAERAPLANNKKNIIYILRGGFYCRGIDGGIIDITNPDSYTFNYELGNGIMEMKTQLGIQNPDELTTAREMKAVLTTDAYVLVSSGDSKVREIQQALNRKYLNILGDYLPTNGLYERNTNTAIKKAIQSEIGVTVDGSWGNATKNALPALTLGSTRTNLVYLLQYLLYLNGFDPNGFDGSFGNGARTAVINFQSLMHLEVDGSVGPQTWFALVLSCGDTSRSANACDTRFEITATRAQVLKDNGYQVVGRYITGGDFKELREGELEVIFNAGLKAFLIYQDNNRQIGDFTYGKGVKAAAEALKGAIKHKIPTNTVIYFAVDMDIYEDQIESNIVPFFQGINDYIADKYKVGIYGPRLVCQRISKRDLAISSFVADMSTGYSCNIGQKIPDNWCYDQFVEISNFNNDFDIDKVIYNGKLSALSSIDETSETENPNLEVENFLKEAYLLAKEYNNGQATYKQINTLVLQYIASSTYDSNLWNFLFNFNEDGIQSIKNNISKDCRNSGFYDIRTNTSIGLPHLAASIYCILNQKTGIGSVDATIADLTGWAGDLLTFAGEFEEGLKDNKYPNCSEELISQLLGSDDSLGFGLEDFLQDIDAWNLYNNLNNFPINVAFKMYYDSSSNRYDGFVNNRLEYGYVPSEGSTDYDKIYMLAKQYLELDFSTASDIVTSIFRALLIKPFSRKDMIENIAKAFAHKLTS